MGAGKVKVSFQFNETGKATADTIDIFEGLQPDEIKFLMYCYHPHSPYLRSNNLDPVEREERAKSHSGFSGDAHSENMIRATTNFLIALNNMKFAWWVSSKIALYNLLERTRRPVGGMEMGDDKEMKAYETLIKCNTGAFEMIDKIARVEDEIFGILDEGDRDYAVAYAQGSAEGFMKQVKSGLDA